MRDKSHGELLAELLDISEKVFEGLILREIMTAPKGIKGIEEKDAEKISIIKVVP